MAFSPSNPNAIKFNDTKSLIKALGFLYPSGTKPSVLIYKFFFLENSFDSLSLNLRFDTQNVKPSRNVVTQSRIIGCVVENQDRYFAFRKIWGEEIYGQRNYSHKS